MSTEVTQAEGQETALAGAASEVQNAQAATAAAGEVEQQQEEAPKEKTFTQAELDALIQKRLAKERARTISQMRREQEEQARAQRLKNEPRREAFNGDDEAFVQAQIRHQAEKLAQEQLTERQQREAMERRNESFMEKVESAKERFPDFETVVMQDHSLPINEAMVEFIQESDVGPDLAYHLAKNRAQAEQISRMSPISAARALAKIESEIAARPKAEKSNAPPPINPVGQRGRSASSNLPSDSDDMDTWARKERERLKQRSR
ncbi:hypothetical protein [Herbaspirillum sp. CAH-3]|uniref:hypothetical protein n=1 Tax=Herbaspirillum sp. CAH-3 TaxID=2605746 RepID=UPI0012ACF2BD|nr:hypothetical protein [Herbaspirillum sp. CAH-3]MRT30811.1 hypothetical protein [Herbaspirillum sp. CAH-3]